MVDIRLKDSVDATIASLPYHVYKMISLETLRNPKSCNMSTIENRIQRGCPNRLKDAQIYMWSTYYEQHSKSNNRALLVNYVCNGSASFEEGKDVARIVTPPLGLPAVSPTKCRNNDEVCVKERILKVRNFKEPPSEYETYRNEFLNKFCPVRTLIPDTPEVIMEKQKKPNQRRRNDQFLNDGHKKKQPVVKSFQKVEAYQDPKAPRNISTCATEDTIDLGCYVAPLKRHMGTFSWFMPCRKPDGIAKAVNEYCRSRKGCRKVIETDYSKFDGSISPFLRTIEQTALLRSYGNEHQKEISRLLERDHDLNGVTSFRVKYKTKASRLSGSQMTTVGNSLINAFVAYCAYRVAGHTPGKSYALIGPKFGDDGIDDIRGDFKTAASDLGLKVTMDTRDVMRFVTFCGRIYLSPATSISSIFKPKKALRSLCVTTGGKDHSSKVFGYLATDPNTPFISDWCHAIIRCHKYEFKSGDWETDFLSRQGPFPFMDADRDLARVVIAEQLDIDITALNSLCAELKLCKCVEDLWKLHMKYFQDDQYDSLPGIRFVEGSQQTVNHALGMIDAEESGSQFQTEKQTNAK